MLNPVSTTCILFAVDELKVLLFTVCASLEFLVLCQTTLNFKVWDAKQKVSCLKERVAVVWDTVGDRLCAGVLRTPTVLNTNRQMIVQYFNWQYNTTWNAIEIALMQNSHINRGTSYTNSPNSGNSSTTDCLCWTWQIDIKLPLNGGNLCITIDIFYCT
jgi:hypothetical protein